MAAPREPIARFELPYTVAADEIDELGHAGNYHYVKWLQQAAVAHSAANGWPPERYAALGAGWVVRSHRITYLKPAFEGDELTIRTWVEDLRRATSLRRYEIVRGDGDLLVMADTDWAFMDYGKQKAVRIPPEVSACFRPLPPGGE